MTQKSRFDPADFGADWRPKTARRLAACQRLLGIHSKHLSAEVADGDILRIKQRSEAIAYWGGIMAIIDTASG